MYLLKMKKKNSVVATRATTNNAVAFEDSQLMASNVVLHFLHQQFNTNRIRDLHDSSISSDIVELL